MSVPALSQSLIGDSRAMEAIRSLIHRVARHDLPVLIQGETGVGKELVAAALHRLSGRRGAFVAFNVCAIADTMFEDSLFGHVRGAFTGAYTATRGYMEEAHEGTLFLDEISELSPAAQVKLLRAVETKTFRPVGGGVNRTSDFRLVAATNCRLGNLVAEGAFREDLAFRLRGIVISVPPLRERAEDIPLLATTFLRSRLGEAASFTRGALEALGDHPWPGNVRELRQVIDCAVSMTDDMAIGKAEIDLALGSREDRFVHLTEWGRRSAERQALIELLESHGWDKDAVAAELKVDRTTVYRRMRRLGLDASERRPARGTADDPVVRAVPRSAG